MYHDFPSEIHASERYVIYSHNLLIEGDNPTPVHPEFGVADFPAIKMALFVNGQFNLIAHHRPKDTEIGPYADKLESWVRRLMKAGVKPSRITLVGFSRGSQLTAYASARLASAGINTAIMAGCADGDIAHDPPLIFGGNFLSIYESTDAFGSCEKLAARSHLTSFKEIALSTGKKHGAFFVPRPEWVQPLKAWIEETNH
jgi:pimeloyl-ACP methyl ester carboxylesterase